MDSLAARLASTRAAISDECRRLGREEPTLIVVTKNHGVDLVRDLYDLGERNFGENRVQEALPKFEEFAELNRPEQVNWHLIGQLQTNKVKQALEFASTIHSLDRESLLMELGKRTINRERPLGVFIQVNLTDDPDRGGISPASLLGFANQVSEIHTLQLEGLMGVASLEKSPDRDFEIIANLSESLAKDHPAASKLSIGMSGDYLPALQFGATHLRIGTAITGNRQK